VSKSTALRAAYLTSELPSEKLVQIPYAVDSKLYVPATADRRSMLREQLGLPTRGVLVLFVGGMTERKGIHYLVDAFNRIMPLGGNAHLIILGPSEKYDPDYVRSLHQQARSGPTPEQIHFIDKLADNVHEYMAASDVFVLPSSREGLPISVLEAMSTGLAVVASNIPEISGDQIRSGEHGLLVPYGDMPALASSLTDLCQDSSLRRSLGEAARARILAEFSPEVVDPQYQALYRKLLAPDDRGP
jgi:glycosyltransferase involved in cell wall biosynthesis